MCERICLYNIVCWSADHDLVAPSLSLSLSLSLSASVPALEFIHDGLDVSDLVRMNCVCASLSKAAAMAWRRLLPNG